MSWRYLSDAELELIRKEHNSGKSGTRIAKLLGRNHSVINRGIKRGINHGRWNRIFSIKFKPKLQNELGEFIGAFAGDGNFYVGKDKSYRVMLFLNQRETDYAEYLEETLYRLLGIKPHIWNYKRGHMVYIILYRKAVYDIIKSFLSWREGEKTYTVKLRKRINEYSDDFLKGFISGLVSTDGSISFKAHTKKRVKIEFSSVSKILVLQYQNALKKFGVNLPLYKRFRGKNLIWFAETNKKATVRKFCELIKIHESNRAAKLKEFYINNGFGGSRTLDLCLT